MSRRGAWLFAVLGILLAAPSQASDATLTRGPYLQQGTSDAIIVRWSTAELVDSRVAYGTDPLALDTEVVVGGSTTDHEVPLTGLSPNTRYYYAVGTSTRFLAGGDTDHFFDSAPPAGTPKPTRVWILGDSGLGGNPALAVRDAYYDHADDLANGGANPRDTDLIVLLGDNAYPTGTQQDYQNGMFDIYFEQLRKSVVWPVIGNHDQFDDATQTYPYYDIFSLPTQAEAGGVASATEAYYSFDYGNIHFVALDSINITIAGYGADLLEWLEADLAAATEDWIIVLQHHPPYTKGAHDSDDPEDSNGRLIWMRENVNPLLEDYGVDLVLAGHSHSYERTYFIDGHYGTSDTFLESMKKMPGDGEENGPTGPYVKPYRGSVPYAGAGDGAVYTVAGSSSLLSPGVAVDLGGTEPNHPAMVNTTFAHGSVVLDVNGNRLDAIFLDETGAVLDQYTMFKGGPTQLPEAEFVGTPRIADVPSTVSFVDLSLHGPTIWGWDFDDDGTPDSAAPNPSHQFTEAGLHSIELEVLNSAGSDGQIKDDYICVTDGPLGEVVGLTFSGSDSFFWNPGPGATAYDVIRGELVPLIASGGAFPSAGVECLENDDEDLQALDSTLPGQDQAFFYLVGGANCAGMQGTYGPSFPNPGNSRDLAAQTACASCATASDDDQDEICAAVDNCPDIPNPDQLDGDGDGLGDACDGCPADPNKTEPGLCGCGISDLDSDSDGTPDCDDLCPTDPDKVSPGTCGCGVPDTDSDNDGTLDCDDGCPADPNKVEPGLCGCGVPDDDSDSDGTPDCDDLCPLDPDKIVPGACGCGVADTDSDLDGTPDCNDLCPLDPNKVVPGACGCGTPDTDSDNDGVADCDDLCPADPDKLEPGLCGCGVSECWITLNSGTTADLNSVDFQQYGETGYAAGSGGTILKTVDGGLHWQIQTSGTELDLSEIVFPSDEKRGFAVGRTGVVLKTVNGGQTWVTLSVPTIFDLQSVYFLGGTNQGYVVGNRGTILVTSNGGNTWTAQNSGTTRDLFSVHFPGNGSVGYAVGSHGTILKTTNGGFSWFPQSAPPPPKNLLDVHFPVDGTAGYIAGASGTLLKTTDGGSDWNHQFSGTNKTLNAIRFLEDSLTGHAVGNSGVIRFTTDGGVTWLPDTTGALIDLNDVEFPLDPTIGYVVGDSGTIRKRITE